MRILINEPQHSGHRYTTVRVLIDALLALDREHSCIDSITVSLSEKGANSEEFDHQLAPVKNQFTLIVVPPIDSSMHPLKVGWKSTLSLKKLIVSGEYDHVYIPYADAVLQILTLVRFWPLSRWWPASNKTVAEVQVMNSAFAYSYGRANRGRIGRSTRRWMLLFALRHSGCDRVHLNDPLGILWLTRNKPDMLSRIKLIPDPISPTRTYDKSTAREKLGLEERGRIVCCVGLINSRKGADTLIKAFEHVNLQKDDRLLLAGKLSDDIAELVRQQANPAIIVLDRYISEEELSLALCAADLIAAPYKQFIGSASIVIRAAQCSRMVLTTNTGWPDYIVNRFKLGTTAPADSPEQFARAIEQALDQSVNFSPDASSAHFIEFNSIGNIHAHWTSLLRERLGIVQDPAITSWKV